jgi:hypothetical protein
MSFHQVKLTKLLTLLISCWLSATLFSVHSQPSRRQNTQRRERIQRPPEPPFIDWGMADKLKERAEAIGEAGKWLNDWAVDRALDLEVEKVQESLEDKARRNGGRLPEGELYQKVVYVDPFGYKVGYQLRFIGSGPTIRDAMRRGRDTPRLEAPPPSLLHQNGNLVFWGPGFVVAPISAVPDLSDLFGKPIEDFIAEQMEQVRAKEALTAQPSNGTSTPPPMRPRPSSPRPSRGRETRGGPDPQRGSPGPRGGGGGNAGQGGSGGNSGQTGGGTGSGGNDTGGATTSGRPPAFMIITAGAPLPPLDEGRPRLIGTIDAPQRITEVGTPNGRAWADFNGDRFPDLCVVLSDIPGTTGLCVTLSTGRRFDQRAAGREIVSPACNRPPDFVCLDVGLPDGRAWVDFNRDRKADYCRVVGTSGNFHLQVTLSAADRFGSTITSSDAIDPGIKETRNWVDWDGDGIPDFVRVVERPGFDPGIAVTFGSPNGFGPTIDNLTRLPVDARGHPMQREIAGVSREDLPRFFNIFDVGHPELTLWMDVNGDGKADYVRVVGSKKDLVSVTLSNGRSLGLTITEPLLPTK